MLDPRAVHALDQFTGLVREMANVLTAYRKELIVGGMGDAEAWALVQRLEERLWSEGLEAAELAVNEPNGLDGTPHGE